MPEPADEGPERDDGDDAAGGDAVATPTGAETSTEELREAVEQRYDFEDFGPADMAEMSVEEWEVAFDASTWITGQELLDRVRADLETRIAERSVFAVLEEVTVDGERCLLAYSEDDYALVRPDGSVEGFGTVMRDVKPVVALCSIDSYDPPEPPADAALPTPGEVPEGSGELGNLMLQVIAAAQLLAGLGLVGSWILGETRVVGLVAGLGFLFIGLLLLFSVANARLSDRFRAREYRDRLRAVGLEDGERPDFLPVADEGPSDGGETG